MQKFQLVSQYHQLMEHCLVVLGNYQDHCHPVHSQIHQAGFCLYQRQLELPAAPLPCVSFVL